MTAMMADWSETLVYKGQSLEGTFSPVNAGDNLDEAGLLSTASAQFVANADHYEALANKPTMRDTVSIAGDLYYIVDIVFDPACVTINVRRN